MKWLQLNCPDSVWTIFSSGNSSANRTMCQVRSRESPAELGAQFCRQCLQNLFSVPGALFRAGCSDESGCRSASKAWSATRSPLSRPSCARRRSAPAPRRRSECRRSFREPTAARRLDVIAAPSGFRPGWRSSIRTGRGGRLEEDAVRRLKSRRMRPPRSKARAGRDGAIATAPGRPSLLERIAPARAHERRGRRTRFGSSGGLGRGLRGRRGGLRGRELRGGGRAVRDRWLAHGLLTARAGTGAGRRRAGFVVAGFVAEGGAAGCGGAGSAAGAGGTTGASAAGSGASVTGSASASQAACRRRRRARRNPSIDRSGNTTGCDCAAAALSRTSTIGAGVTGMTGAAVRPLPAQTREHARRGDRPDHQPDRAWAAALAAGPPLAARRMPPHRRPAPTAARRRRSPGPAARRPSS